MSTSTTLTIRMPQELRDGLQEFADRKFSNPSRIVCEMVGTLVKADQVHADRLVWPPRFDFHPGETDMEKRHKLPVNGLPAEVDSVLKEAAKSQGTTPDEVLKQILVHYLLAAQLDPKK